MKNLWLLTVVLFTMLLYSTVLAQNPGSLNNGVKIPIPEKIQGPLGNPLTAGTYTVGTAGDFPSIDSAFNKLSIDGIAGEITLELIDDLYTAPTDSFGFVINGPIPGADEYNRVIIQPAQNKNVTIEGSGSCVFLFNNTSYLTLDGVNLTGSTTLTVHAQYNNQFDGNGAIVFQDNSDHNVVQNIIAGSADINRIGIAIFFEGLLSTPDYNLVQHNLIKIGAIGICVISFINSNEAEGNTVRDNFIGSEVDSLIAWGILVQHCHNTTVQNNLVQNMTVNNTIAGNINIGINSYWCNGAIIRNNVVHNIKSTAGNTSAGILLSGDIGNTGSDNLVYNNMIYDIQSSSTQYNSRVTGIQMWNQNNPKIYYNSVYLNGIGNGANPLGSAALFIDDACSSVDSKNNILINTREESPYCASSIYDYTASNFTSDYNDLFYSQNLNNCLVRIGSTKYSTLADWQTTGHGLNSITEMPNFIEPALHINEADTTNLESHAISISEIETDIDGDFRNATSPDIGADEFNGIPITPVELTSFTASTNVKEVMLNWSTATEINNRGFEIQRSKEGTEFFTVGFVKGHGTTSEPQRYNFSDKNLNNGKNFYRLKQVDFNGSFEYSDVIEVEWKAFNSYLLEKNFPNPFNPSTTIGFGIQEKSKVKIIVLNAIGEQVAIVLNEEKEPGYHQVKFNAANLPSGVYFYQINAGKFIQTKKMILMK